MAKVLMTIIVNCNCKSGSPMWKKYKTQNWVRSNVTVYSILTIYCNMKVKYCNIVWSNTESIQYDSTVPIVRLHPVLSTKSLNDWGHSCSPNIWLHTWTSLSHCKPRIEDVVYKCSSYSISSGTCICPLLPLTLPLSDIVTLCFARAI